MSWGIASVMSFTSPVLLLPCRALYPVAVPRDALHIGKNFC